MTGSEKTRYDDQRACKAALDDLHEKVSEARVALEDARTDAAKGALLRAVAQQDALQKLAAKFAKTSPTSVPAAITDISAPKITAPGTEVILTVSPFRPAGLAAADMEVSVGGHVVKADRLTNLSGDTWQVVFVAPPPAPASQGMATEQQYDVVLLVGKNRLPVENKSGKKLQY